MVARVGDKNFGEGLAAGEDGEGFDALLILRQYDARTFPGGGNRLKERGDIFCREDVTQQRQTTKQTPAPEKKWMRFHTTNVGR